MVISTEGSMERNFRIANNNAIDMQLGKDCVYGKHYLA